MSTVATATWAARWGPRAPLDLNYLARAEQLGTEVRPLHVVTGIEPLRTAGYRVHFDRLHQGERIADSATAHRVVLAAGSLGSTELLLRCRDHHGTLPNVSPGSATAGRRTATS